MPTTKKTKPSILDNILFIGLIRAILGIFVCLMIALVFIDLNRDSECVGVNKLQGYVFYMKFPFVTTLSFPPPNAILCSNVFLEGIYEASMFDPNGATKIDQICDYINSESPFKSWNRCNFNLGISIVYDKRSRINSPEGLQRFIDSKIRFCESLPKDGVDCITGVYTGVNIAYQDETGTSKYPIKDNDPFWLCKVGKGNEYQVNCLRNMVSYLYVFTKGDLNKGVEIIQNFPVNEEMHFEIKLTFFSSLAFIYSLSNNDIYKICTNIKDKNVRYACIEGYATGLDEVLPSGGEAKGLIEYCLNSPYTFDEKGQCVRRGFFELPISTDFKIKENACLVAVPKIYTKFCENFANFLDYSPFKQKSRSDL